MRPFVSTGCVSEKQRGSRSGHIFALIPIKKLSNRRPRFHIPRGTTRVPPLLNNACGGESRAWVKEMRARTPHPVSGMPSLPLADRAGTYPTRNRSDGRNSRMRLRASGGVRRRAGAGTGTEVAGRQPQRKDKTSPQREQKHGERHSPLRGRAGWQASHPPGTAAAEAAAAHRAAVHARRREEGPDAGAPRPRKGGESGAGPTAEGVASGREECRRTERRGRGQ